MRHQKRRGNVLVEFCLVLVFLLMPMFLFTYGICFNLLTQLEVIQFCRDAGHLWSTSTVDLSPASPAQTILNSLGQSAGFRTNAQVIFSKLVYVDAATCQAGDNTPACPNLNKWAYTQYLTIGTAPSLGPSTYGTFLPIPSGGTQATDGSWSLADTTKVSTLAISGLPTQLSQIQPFNSVSVTGLPSGQTINVVQVGATPFNVPGVTNFLALTDFAVF
ncbi:MAG TPA: hypothetical protein VN893_15805 [Bryobacteraceae bacterium]|jgi:hypothetical protein|nr:hypothetical protein [Bryobacteraceae bacterium]